MYWYGNQHVNDGYNFIMKVYCIPENVNAFTLQNFVEAEEDFRKNLDPENSLYVGSNFHLGLSLYYQGKVRVSVSYNVDMLRLCMKLSQVLKQFD